MRPREIGSHQHPKGSVWVHPSTVWGVVSAINFSEDHGQSPPRQCWWPQQTPSTNQASWSTTTSLLLMERLNALLVTAAQIRSWTDKAPGWKYVLQKLLKTNDKQMTPCFQMKEELSTEDSCTLELLSITKASYSSTSFKDLSSSGSPTMHFISLVIIYL